MADEKWFGGGDSAKSVLELAFDYNKFNYKCGGKIKFSIICGS